MSSRSPVRPLLAGVAVFVMLAALTAWVAACVLPELAGPTSAPLASEDERSRVRDADGAETTVVLVSLDGTRPVDVTPARLPSLVALGRRGLVAEGLVPVDPSNTFPSHVSLVTGVRPEVHRLVNNLFVDPVRGRFFRNDPHSWIESEPIWSIAERQGIPTASYYWVGSEGPWAGGPGPRETRRFSASTPERRKVDRVLAWLDEPDPAKRPRLVTTWFHGADHAAHETGPDSPAVTRLLAVQDAEIARLVAGIEARGLLASTTLIFVSDHGMVLAERKIRLEERLRRAGLQGADVLGIGGFASVVFEAGSGNEAERTRAVAVAREAGLEAWLREEAPADWHVDDVRFGDVVVRAPIGTAIVGATTRIDGFHGYPGSEPSMAGLLVAAGRGIEPGTRIGRISALAIAPTVLALLGLPIPEQMTTPPIPQMLRGLAVGRAPEGGRDDTKADARATRVGGGQG
ncbi:MAG: alkaline phosphatase family protein [Myxococcales bacterium]|nr:alkaline phosphatase family protein [Myxococcales bacterium]